MKLSGILAACVVAWLCGTTATSQAPETYRFTPTAFYTTYSFAHPPALRIRPGDRVITKTIAAAGTDWNNNPLSPGGNAQTPPFLRRRRRAGGHVRRLPPQDGSEPLDPLNEKA